MGSRAVAFNSRQFTSLLVVVMTLIDLLMAQTFLTDADFVRALQDERVTYLTEQDFLNANKFPITLSTASFGTRKVLSKQPFYRGDIRGKAAWKRTDHARHSLGKQINNNEVRYNGVTSHVKKWVGARIPYVLSTDYSERERAIIARAFQDYHSKTCIRFVPRTAADRDYLYVGKIDGCFSDVGRAGGRQELSLDNGCLHHDTIIHELMHSIGFYHEHERWDRDRFISILWPNIDREAYDQFGRVDLTESSYYGQPYDYFSASFINNAMAFSKNGLETLNAKVPEMTKVIGSVTNFSPIDLVKIQRMYQCQMLKNGFLPSPVVTSTPSFFNNNNVRSMALADVPPPFTTRFNIPSNLMAYRAIAMSKPRKSVSVAAKFDRLQRDPARSNAFTERMAPSTPMKESCMDKSALCLQWSDRCNSAFFEPTMREYCGLSCGLCSNVEEMVLSDMPAENDVVSDVSDRFQKNPHLSVNSFPVLVNAPPVY